MLCLNDKHLQKERSLLKAHQCFSRTLLLSVLPYFSFWVTPKTILDWFLTAEGTTSQNGCLEANEKGNSRHPQKKKHAHWAMCAESGSIDFSYYSDREGVGCCGGRGGHKNYPLTSSREPSTFVIPFDQISVRDECHAPFQPTVRGTRQWLCGVRACVRVKSCVHRLPNVAGGMWGEKESGRIPFPTSCGQFQLTSTRHTQAGIDFNQSTAALV